MWNKKFWLFAVFFILLSVPIAISFTDQISIQGRLEDSSSRVLSGDHNFLFQLYDSNSVGRNLLWQETHFNEGVSFGLWNVTLGDLNQDVSLSSIDYNSAVWLEITVDGEAQTPLIRFSSIGSAFLSEKTLAAGNNTFVQFNDSGFLGADKNFFYNSTTDQLGINGIQFNVNYTPPSEPEGLVWWNADEHTLNISSGLGQVLQVGQETAALVYNGTGTQIDNGEVIYGVGTFQGFPSIALANATTHETISRGLGVATMDIPDGTFGIVTAFGKVRGVDTSSFSVDDLLWIDPDVNGGLTNTRPTFPDYDLFIGRVLISDASEGIIFVNIIGSPLDTTLNFWNGTLREPFDFNVTSNGSTITGNLNPDNGNEVLTMIFSDGLTLLDVTPAATVILTAGTDSNPQFSFVYIPISTKVLTASTSNWANEEHIKVATVVLRTASTTQTDGALRNQNWNDHIQNTDNIGHLVDISERLRQEPAKWESGIEGSLTIVSAPTPDDVFVANTSGIVYQLHQQAFPAMDTNASNDIHIVNDSSSAFKTVSNLNGETTDALGNSLTNGSFSFVMWGVMNRTGEPSHLMLNLPVCKYGKNSPEDAVSDVSNCSVYDIPSDFEGVGFLIARFTLILDAAGNVWTLHETQDLRGFIPNVTAGGGAGGGGVSTILGLTDTPSSYTGNALKILQVASGETAMEFTSTPTFDDVNVQFDINTTRLCLNGTQQCISDWADVNQAVNGTFVTSETFNAAFPISFDNNVSFDSNAVLDGRYILINDSNNTARLLYNVIADPPFIPSTAEWDANYLANVWNSDFNGNFANEFNNRFTFRGSFDSNAVLDSRYITETDANGFYVKVDGTNPLTANWGAGGYDINSGSFTASKGNFNQIFLNDPNVAPSSINIVAVLTGDFNPTGAADGTRGIHDERVIFPKSTGTSGHTSFSANVTFDSTFDADHYNFFQGMPDWDSPQTLDRLAIFVSIPIVSAGTVNEVSAMDIRNTTGAGTVGIQYGVFVRDVLTKGATNWAWYSTGDTNSFFGGNVGLGVAPTQKLQVDGEILTDDKIVIIASVGNSSSFIADAPSVSNATAMATGAISSNFLYPSTKSFSIQARTYAQVVAGTPNAADAVLTISGAGDTTLAGTLTFAETLTGNGTTSPSFTLDNSNDNWTFQTLVSNKDMVFGGNDGGTPVEMMRLDSSGRKMVWSIRSSEFISMATSGFPLVKLSGARGNAAGRSMFTISTSDNFARDDAYLIFAEDDSGGTPNTRFFVAMNGDGFFDGMLTSDIAIMGATAGTEEGLASNAAQQGIRVIGGTSVQNQRGATLSFGNPTRGSQNKIAMISAFMDDASDVDVGGLKFYVKATTSTNGNLQEALSLSSGGNATIVGNIITDQNITIGQVLKITPMATAPPSPSEGWIYADSSTNELCYYDGSSWTGLKAGGVCA